MNKKEVIEAVAKVFADKISELKSSLEGTRDRARDAPGHNVSHSDTSRFQLSNLALGIEKQVVEYEEILKQIKGVALEPADKISVGSLFTLCDTDSDEEKNFLMLYQGGGEKITVDGVEITTLSITAPIAQACLGKETDDEVKYRNNTFEVTEIL